MKYFRVENFLSPRRNQFFFDWCSENQKAFEKVIKINGINNTTWTPSWNHGKTQVIRVPIALADQILEYAKWLDTHKKSSDAKTEDFIVLSAVDRYIKWRRQSYYHANKYAKEPNLNSRAWDELRKFRWRGGDMGTNFKASN